METRATTGNRPAQPTADEAGSPAAARTLPETRLDVRDPMMLGRYRLIAPLAQGGMAEIFLARHEGPGGFEKDVVIKRVHPHLARDARFAAMFLDEARLAARLSHPNIVNITDLGEADGSYFLCMERLEGADLTAILLSYTRRKRTIPVPIAALIASAACDGLHFAHTLTDAKGEGLGLVHRDISPSNIFITHQGAVKVLDFGIAKARGRAIQTESGEIKGKIIYMSPEQARGEELDARSDIFALGIVLYEMVTGVRPFQREEMLASLAAVAHGRADPPKKLRPDLPPELNAIITTAMHPNREKRFRSACEMRQALDEYLTGCTTGPAASMLQRFMADLRRGDEDAEPKPSGPPSRLAQTAALPQPEEDKPVPAPEKTVAREPPSGADRRRHGARRVVGALALALVAAGGAVWALRARGETREAPVLTHASPPPLPNKEAPLPNNEAVKAVAPSVPPKVEVTQAAAPTTGTVPMTDLRGGDVPAPSTPSLPAELKQVVSAAVASSAGIVGPEPLRPPSPPPPRPQKKQSAVVANGLLTVQCAPQWCLVSIDGKDEGYSPILKKSLTAGAHRVVVVHPRTNAAQSRTVDVTANNESTAKFQVQ